MCNDLFAPGATAPDKVVRTIAVYFAIAVLLWLDGKRDLAQLNSFDLVVVLLLSYVVQSAIIGPDNSLTGGLLGATVLLAVNAFVVVDTRPDAQPATQADVRRLAAKLDRLLAG